jgi:DinB family protein
LDAHQLFDRLRANATVFDALTRGVSEEQARWRPTPEEWSILEVVSHLADEEVEDFRLRVDLTLHRPGEAWPPIDPQAWAQERRYNARDLGQSVETFMSRRDRSLRWLTALERPDWTVTSEHPRLGPVSAGDLMVSWVGHDLIHIRQLNRLHRQYLVGEAFPEQCPDYAGPW